MTVASFLGHIDSKGFNTTSIPFNSGATSFMTGPGVPTEGHVYIVTVNSEAEFSQVLREGIKWEILCEAVINGFGLVKILIGS